MFQSHPVTIIYIQIQSRHIEFYSASLIINAHLTGLRYLMFHWPTLSAIVGIGTNLFFIALVCTLSYLHFVVDEESTDDSFSYDEKGEAEDEKDNKTVSERELFYGTSNLLHGGGFCKRNRFFHSIVVRNVVTAR